jgi:uncharacterized protein (DUF2141 family)
MNICFSFWMATAGRRLAALLPLLLPTALLAQPTISSISPGSGPLGTSVVLTGTNLSGLTSVRVGSVPASFTVQSATQATATVPRQAVSQRLRVSSAAGTGLSTATFTVTRPTVIEALSGQGRLTTDGTASLGLGTNAAPAVCDLDNDGLLDLLVGNSAGNVARYEQTTANGNIFAGGSLLTTTGTTALDATTNAAPAVTDLDGDGLLDLLVGAFSGVVWHYEQTTAGGTAFGPVGVGYLTTDGTAVLVGGSSAVPTLADLDGDGLLDLLVGSDDGTVFRFEQTTATGNIFAGGSRLTIDGTNGVDVGNNAAPAITDLDGDGLLDLLVGSQLGEVRAYEQTTANGSIFAGGSLLSDGSTTVDVGTFAAPAVTDVDGDGLLDLLLGGSNGFVQRFEQTMPPPPTLSGFSPASGPIGTSLTLTGTALNYLTGVTLGGVPAAFTINSPTSVTVTVPPGATTQAVRVTTPTGTALSADAFAVTRLSPSVVLPTLGNLTTDGSTALDAGSSSVPAVTDLDNDGLLDLLVGNGGAIARYEQTTAGAFAALGSLTSNGSTALNAGSRAAPTVTDLDGNGRLDLLVGNAAGNVLRFEQTTAGGSTFAALGSLTTDGTTVLDAGTNAVPAVTDLDGNGLLDLLVGNAGGNVQRFEQPTEGSSIFAALGNLTTDGVLTISVAGGAWPSVTDLDGDGRLDLLVGESTGGVRRYEQRTPNRTTLALMGSLTTDGSTALSGGSSAAPVVTDVDGDGLLDLLVGNAAGNVRRFEQLPLATVAVSPGSGPLGTTLTLTGTNLATLSSVQLGGVPAAFTVQSGTQATAVVPPGATTQPVQVTTLAGAALSSAAFQVTRPLPSAVLAGGAGLTTNGTALLSAGTYAAPAATDLDNDGLLDLLVGNLTGNVLRFEQTTAGGDQFVARGALTTNGTTSLDAGDYAAPVVTDLDGDGLLDLLVGTVSGYMLRYEQTTANGSIFAGGANLINQDGVSLSASSNANPTITDLDGDGLLDLLVGDVTGQVQRFEQLFGSDRFAELGALTVGSTALDAGIRSAPTPTDLDGDGLLDLLVSTANGSVQRYEQTPTAGVFVALGPLTTDGSTVLAAGSFAIPVVTDVDGDGELDLLVGNQSGNVLRYEQFVPPPPTLTGFSPPSGPIGTTLILTGTNLSGLSSVTLGGIPAAFTVQSATQATAVMPPGATGQRVRVSTPTGTALSAATFQLTRRSGTAIFPPVAMLTTDGSTALDAGATSNPAVTDVDGNGLLDLLVGNQAGTIQRFEQTTAGGSSFALAGSFPTAGSVAATNAARANPTVTDLDGDGRLDLLVGNPDGQVRRYQQTQVNGSVFADSGLLTTDGSTILDVSFDAFPAVTDLDGDGLLDLVVSNSAGIPRRFEQTTVGGDQFANLGYLTSNGTTPLSGSTSGTPIVTDLDGDGLLELLMGNLAGTVQRFEQTTVGGDQFAVLGALTTDGTTVLDVGARATPAVTDVDGDGLLDLLVGNADGTIQRFEQLPAPTLTAVGPAAELPGQPVTLTGTGFTSGSTVSFGGVAAASVSYTSATSLTAVVPAGATPGSSALTVGSYDVASAAASSPTFEVLAVYRDASPSGCLSTAPLTLSGTGGAGAWRYLRLPAAQGGGVVAAIEDTRNLGTVTAGVLALGTATSAAVRTDGRASRRYLDRNFYLTATNQTFTGQTVRVRFFGLSSELSRLTAVDANATLTGLNVSQYDGANEDCQLGNNSPAGTRRLLPAPATVLSGADWFTAQLSVTDHFSEFYLTGASTPLPVELTTFTATAEDHSVRLAWTTASELNSARFDIERSADGQVFGKIGEQAAQGTTARPSRYTFRDPTPPPHQPTYYRLRQVDLDGTASYSPVRVVTLDGQRSLTLYPNPARTTVAVGGVSAGAAVEVYDALGRPVAHATADASGTAHLTLPAGLAAGVYLVRSGAQARRLTVE